MELPWKLERGSGRVPKTLYVGNLPWSTTEDELQVSFGAHGQVHSCRIIVDRETGRSRGFGFVEVEDPDCEQVIQNMNGFLIGGRELVVSEAKPRQQRL
jgi:RNA recognition motif-containing protein